MATTENAEILEGDSARPSKRTRAFAFGEIEPDAADRALSYPRRALGDVTNNSQRQLRVRLRAPTAENRVELQQRGGPSVHALCWIGHM